eukprot:scaffold32727_cov69-Phaeocystis_antarctica.AAC.1
MANTTHTGKYDRLTRPPPRWGPYSRRAELWAAARQAKRAHRAVLSTRDHQLPCTTGGFDGA